MEEVLNLVYFILHMIIYYQWLCYVNSYIYYFLRP